MICVQYSIVLSRFSTVYCCPTAVSRFRSLCVLSVWSICLFWSAVFPAFHDGDCSKSKSSIAACEQFMWHNVACGITPCPKRQSSVNFMQERSWYLKEWMAMLTRTNGMWIVNINVVVSLSLMVIYLNDVRNHFTRSFLSRNMFSLNLVSQFAQWNILTWISTMHLSHAVGYCCMTIWCSTLR